MLKGVGAFSEQEMFQNAICRSQFAPVLGYFPMDYIDSD